MGSLPVTDLLERSCDLSILSQCCLSFCNSDGMRACCEDEDAPNAVGRNIKSPALMDKEKISIRGDGYLQLSN